MAEVKKVMLAFGTRPEAIKMAPLVHRLKSQPSAFDVTVCVTAQHREMLDQVLRMFDIRPEIDLDLMRPGQELSDITANILQRMKMVLANKQPDLLLVHGDTTTTLAAAMAGFYADVQVGHVEAGLRTYDMHAPFPEEFNRQVTSKIAKWHFAPTEQSRRNLILEGVHDRSIVVTGNTVIDALRWTLARIHTDPGRGDRLDTFISQFLPFDWKQDRFALITGHRRENFGVGVRQICEALKELAHQFGDFQFVYPLHMNPNIRGPVGNLLMDVPNIHLIEPLDYEPFIYLLKHSFIVLTDSGGVQEEAPSLGKPVLVMRDVTERPEAIASGTVELVGTNKRNIVNGVSKLIKDDAQYRKMSRSQNPYGDGNACDRIAQTLLRADLKKGSI
ncbi:UDP-N-acetylglucosamine 2-epimerase (non-hydrolyzing) [Alphaproteobacteria bacterium]|nr:UDP-N-acetylglucosamine 2-epimerase (non-hydrolyzing) [Alphaproteobacteria bacterium]